MVPSGKDTHLGQIIWAKHTEASNLLVYLFILFLFFFLQKPPFNFSPQTESQEGTVGLVEKVGHQLQVETLIWRRSRQPQPQQRLLDRRKETGGGKQRSPGVGGGRAQAQPTLKLTSEIGPVSGSGLDSGAGPDSESGPDFRSGLDSIQSRL